MTSRTPIRLTPHRGPLATPSTSPESSPTSSTPPTDMSYPSMASTPTLDLASLQCRMSTLSRPTQDQSWSHLDCRRNEITKQGPFGHSTCLSPLGLTLESLMYSTSELAQTLTGIVTFCVLVWGLLEWSSYVSELPRQPSLSRSTPRFPLPPPTRALRCHVNSALCEPSDQQVAVLQFLSEQIQHAKALSSLSVGLGLPFRAFLEAHRAIIPSTIFTHNHPELPNLVQGVDTLTNLTEALDPPILELMSSSFIGRSFTLALEEFGDLISEPMVSHGASTHREYHLHAIYWRAASNLLLEYSAARPRARRLLQHLRVLHRQLSPFISDHDVNRSTDGRLNIWWWKSIARHPAIPIEGEMQVFVTGLEVALDNVHRLVAYLDWITEQLARTTLKDVLKTRHRTDFSSCMISLQELFVQSKPSTPKKICFCLNDYGVVPHTRPERAEVTIPGSPTVHAEQ